MEIGFIVLLVVMVSLIFLMIASLWIVFAKAGQPGWTSIVPILNLYIMLKIAGKPGWWLILCIIPIVNVIVNVVMIAGLAENFGKGIGFTLGLLFLPMIFFPVLAFGDAVYVG
ncbi:MAG: hypothetical protein K1X53_09050 [Candidatus Sumerlaeaceae bacterium]|nr:hypothetical protein [Candidatus Sumerlaeaceae bacterium]